MAKGSLNVKAADAVPLDELQAALNPAQPTGLNASVADVGGEINAAKVEQYQKIQEQPIQVELDTAKDSLGDKIAAAAQESYTGYIVQAMERSYNDQYADYDPTFQGTRRAQELITSMGIEASESNLEILGRAGNADDQMELAQQLAQHHTNQEILNRHGGYALASGVLDPTTLLVDFATFGASKALTLGRLASGTLGAVAGTSLTGAADMAGRSTTGFDYVLNAGLTGGAMALFGGAGASHIASGGNFGGLGRVNIPGTNGRLAKVINDFTSETDKLMYAAPDSAAVLKPLMDDPVRRTTSLTNNNAASFLRRYGNEFDGYMASYDGLLEQGLKEQQGWSFVSRKLDLSGKYGTARDDLNKRVAEELLRRNDDWQKFGNVMHDPHLDPLVKKLADESDRIHAAIGEKARDAGVRGFENFQAQPGYFHRSWNESLIQGIERAHPGTARALIAQSALAGIKGIGADEADAIATALLQRVKDKAHGTRSDFMGGLGKTDNQFIREAMEASKMPQPKIDSIMAKIEQKASDQGTTKYGKHRLSFDMTASIKTADGTTYRMSDLIDTDLDRVMENYTSSMAGRTALAKAGVAGDDAELEALKRNYMATLKDLPLAKQNELMDQLEGLIGDFTGNRPAQNVLGPVAQRVKAIADATMLSGSGLWQVAEYTTLAQRHGLVQTGKAFFKAFPGVKQILHSAKQNPDLADELATVLQVDLARDVRVRPWKRQHDVNLSSSDTKFDRLLHAGKQAVPYLNGMKYIQANQARMNANLALNKLARAAQGDAGALKQIMEYAPDLDWPRVKQALLDNATYNGKNATSMNWGGWAKADIDSTMNVALRIMDDALLFGRPGQGSSFSRSAVGQVLGQFQSFVALAHNKTLRGTLNTSGVGALATVLAYQYPATFLMVMVNEARKGQLDTSDAGLTKVAKGALGYTAGLGFFSGAASIAGLTGGRAGMSVPLTGIMDAPARALGGINKMYEGEYRSGSADIAKSASMVIPFINAMPGTAAVLDAWRGE
jgi:hypothetical protein